MKSIVLYSEAGNLDELLQRLTNSGMDAVKVNFASGEIISIQKESSFAHIYDNTLEEADEQDKQMLQKGLSFYIVAFNTVDLMLEILEFLSSPKAVVDNDHGTVMSISDYIRHVQTLPAHSY